MAVLTAGFNPSGATNGSSIATTDTGDLTAFSTVSKGGTSAITYDNTHTLFGKALAAKLAQAGGTANLQWSAYAGAGVDFGRLYVYLSTAPSIVSPIFVGSNGGSLDFRIDINTSQKVELRQGAGTILATSTTTLATGQWYRLEWHASYTSPFSPTIDIYTSPDSATSAETVTASGSFNASTTSGFIGPNTVGNWTFWVAQVVARGTAAIGPYPVNSVAPTVSGLTPVGSTITASAGTYNGTFTLTYQWQANGVDISGATSSTYVTQAGDAGKAIGVREIATGQQATNETISTVSSNTVTVAGGSSGSSSLALSSVHGTFLNLKGIR